jgi:PEP-CTERM/exosortase A-associated glycosyltransferase
MKILHVLDHSLPVFSGYSFRSANIVRFQKHHGLDPVVLTSPKQGSDDNGMEEIAGIRYYRTASLPVDLAHRLPFIKECLLMSRLKKRIVEVVNAEHINLIHSHSPSLNGLPSSKVAHASGLPFVYEARAFWEDAAVDHGTFAEDSLRYRLSRALETHVFQKAQASIVIAAGMRQELCARGINEGAVSIIPNGVDVEGFRPKNKNHELARKLDLGTGPVFGFIGSYYHYEGLRFLIETFPLIIDQLPTAKLLLIGGGPEEEILRQASACLAGAIRMLGHIPHEEVPDYYSIMDVLVFPRSKMRLTDLVTPLKPLEAMAMGKAVLASDVGGHRELIQHELTGLLFRADDAKALTAEAVRVGSDPALRQRLGSVARSYVEQKCQWPDIVSAYSHIYQRLFD